jgi:hypothetical protein
MELDFGSVVDRRLSDGWTDVTVAVFRLDMSRSCLCPVTWIWQWPVVGGDGLIGWGKTAVLMMLLLWSGQSVAYPGIFYFFFWGGGGFTPGSVRGGGLNPEFFGGVTPGIFSERGGGGFQQIQLGTEGRENGDLGAVAP